MRITRPRATKLSQITIDADLEMGAHNITLGALQTVDGRDVSLQVDWVLLDEVVNTNNGNILSLDTGTITAMDMYMIVFAIRSVGDANELELQINGLVGDNYGFMRIIDSTMSSPTTQPWWTLVGTLNTNKSANGVYYVQGKKDADANLSFFGNAQSSDLSVSPIAIRGYYSGVVGDITRLNLFSGGNATGWIKIFGMNK